MYSAEQTVQELVSFRNCQQELEFVGTVLRIKHFSKAMALSKRLLKREQAIDSLWPFRNVYHCQQCSSSRHLNPTQHVTFAGKPKGINSRLVDKHKRLPGHFASIFFAFPVLSREAAPWKLSKLSVWWDCLFLAH